MSERPDLTIVMPTLEEAAGLAVLIPRIKAVLGTLGVRGEILIVDGGSQDGTAAVATSHGAIVMRQKGRGFGSAVREGIAAAHAPWVGLLDADGSHDPGEFARFWGKRGDAELIIGSRYCRGGSADMPILRQILSRALNMVTRRVLDLPVRESSSGFRLYDRAAAMAVGSAAEDFSVQQDLLVGILAAGGRVIELPIHYAPRVGGASKANAWKLLPAYMRLLWRLKKQRGGWRTEAGLFAALAVALVTGLTGITGGLPGVARLRALPPEIRSSSDFSTKLAEQWHKLYAEIERSHAEMRPDEPNTSVVGRVTVPAGWSFPPPPLINSARSLLTQTVNPDEKKSFIILGRMRPWRFEFEPLYAQYGGAFIYPLGAVLAAAHVVRLVVVTADLAHYLSVPGDMARLYLVGRLYTLFFHLALVWMLFELGRALSGRGTGTAAALLWALVPVAVVNSHVLKPHPVAAFWLVTAAYCALRAVEEGRWIDYLLCGLCAGAAAGGNLAASYAIGLPVLARLIRREGPWGTVLGACAAGVGVIVVTNPFLVFAPKHFAWELMVYSPSSFSLRTRGLVAFVTRVVPEEIGIGLGSLAALGILRGLFAGSQRRLLSILIFGGGVLVLGRFSSFAASTSSMRLHYAGVALAVVLAADLIAALPRPMRAILLAAALAETGARASAYLLNLHREAGAFSTKTHAADWIDAHIPGGANVGLLRFPEPAHTPNFRWDRMRLTIFEAPKDLAGVALPEWIVVSERGWAALDPTFQARYATAAAFPAATFLGLRPGDDSFFSNAGMLVLQRGASR